MKKNIVLAALVLVAQLALMPVYAEDLMGFQQQTVQQGDLKIDVVSWAPDDYFIGAVVGVCICQEKMAKIYKSLQIGEVYHMGAEDNYIMNAVKMEENHLVVLIYRNGGKIDAIINQKTNK